MLQVEFQKDSPIFHLKRAQKLWALKSTLKILLANIKREGQHALDRASRRQYAKGLHGRNFIDKKDRIILLRWKPFKVHYPEAQRS